MARRRAWAAGLVAGVALGLAGCQAQEAAPVEDAPPPEITPPPVESPPAQVDARLSQEWVFESLPDLSRSISGLALGADGTTALLSQWHGDNGFFALELLGLGSAGEERWSRLHPDTGRLFPHPWGNDPPRALSFRLWSAPQGFVVADSARSCSICRDVASEIDLGCGAMGGTRLVYYDATGQCLQQRRVEAQEVDALTFAPDGTHYALGNSGLVVGSVHMRAPDGEPVKEATYLHLWSLSAREDGTLLASSFGKLLRIGSDLELQGERELGVELFSDPVAGPAGQLAFLGGTSTGTSFRWGGQEVPSALALLFVHPDGTPGAAVPLESSTSGYAPHRLASDASGVVVAAQDGQQALEVRAYGWSGQLEAQRRVEVNAYPSPCDTLRPCALDWHLESVVADPVHGIRLAGAIRGDASFRSQLPASMPANTQRLFVIALRR